MKIQKDNMITKISNSLKLENFSNKELQKFCAEVTEVEDSKIPIMYAEKSILLEEMIENEPGSCYRESFDKLLSSIHIEIIKRFNKFEF